MKTSTAAAAPKHMTSLFRTRCVTYCVVGDSMGVPTCELYLSYGSRAVKLRYPIGQIF